MFRSTPFRAIALVFVAMAVFALAAPASAHAGRHNFRNHSWRASPHRHYAGMRSHHRHWISLADVERGIEHAKVIVSFPTEPSRTVFGEFDVSAPSGGGSPFDSFGESFGGTVMAKGAVASLVRITADSLGVPERLALAVAHFESGFNMRMRGRSGERGAMQVLPQTARHVGIYGNLYGAAGIRAGVLYLKEALDDQGRYGLCAALSAYNHGLGYVRCTGYGRTILALARGAPSLRSALWQAQWSVPTGRHHRHHWRA